MKPILLTALKLVRNAISDFFSDDMELITPEFRRILNNKDDFRAYKAASDKIRTGAIKASFTLKNGEVITLVNSN